MRILESRFADVRFRGAEQAVRSDKKVQFSSTKKPMPIALVLVRSGDLVIECTWHGAEADMAWAAKVLDLFFAQSQR